MKAIAGAALGQKGVSSLQMSFEPAQGSRLAVYP
jgi:hypothetical protein